ncbi:MAG: hypothetical protein JXA44_07035 [Methanospirillaceae archaeon]|nr:hypothetical protein [Methanospirillaceae archaeon]
MNIHRIIVAVAYLTEDSCVHTMAEKKGLFVIRATGDSASIIIVSCITF